MRDFLHILSRDGFIPGGDQLTHVAQALAHFIDEWIAAHDLFFDVIEKPGLPRRKLALAWFDFLPWPLADRCAAD